MIGNIRSLRTAFVFPGEFCRCFAARDLGVRFSAVVETVEE